MPFLRALKNSRWCDRRLLIWPVALGLIWKLPLTAEAEKIIRQYPKPRP